METKYWSNSSNYYNECDYVISDYVNISDKDLFYYEYNYSYDNNMIWKYQNTVKRMKLTHKDAHPID